VVAVDEPHDAASSDLDLWLCDLEPRGFELDLLWAGRETAADDGDVFEIRRTSLMTRTLKMRAAIGTTRKMNISVVHDQTDQNVDIAADVKGRTSHRPYAAL